MGSSFSQTWSKRGLINSLEIMKNFTKDYIFTGKSLVVDMWSPSLRGLIGRLVSFPQLPTATDHCLSFFYKLYGPNTGEDVTEQTCECPND